MPLHNQSCADSGGPLKRGPPYQKRFDCRRPRGPARALIRRLGDEDQGRRSPFDAGVLCADWLSSIGPSKSPKTPLKSTFWDFARAKRPLDRVSHIHRTTLGGNNTRHMRIRSRGAPKVALCSGRPSRSHKRRQRMCKVCPAHTMATSNLCLSRPRP
jgi:hypothetical protein